MTSEANSTQVIRVTGGASAEEIAALVAVLSAAGGAADVRTPRRSAWADPAWRLAGPGATVGGWRTSSLPR
ncbi:MAG: hypothetical protein L0H79_15640 [Intrasporangium sp.]|uniref:acyl-CoA carboxylase epsilon subunit n=1 Tax=Intrasporangium sp. TaxID=1925024 RepID=UPI002649C666|nr:acyl-CoA carboxylase epsilon subunit [Intrasporangium sp.]MDN5797168.1 hypothetical protein [Intrasporangium sp.]